MPRLTKAEHPLEVKGALVVPNVSDGFSLDIQRLARRSQVLLHEGRTLLCAHFVSATRQAFETRDLAEMEINLYQQRALNAPK